MKGKQNFILEGVTVILIITCDTKKERKKGRRQIPEWNNERYIYIYIHISFFHRAHGFAYTEGFAACVPVYSRTFIVQ